MTYAPMPIMPPSGLRPGEQRELDPIRRAALSAFAQPLPLPWNVIAPHEDQALKNHGQTLARLRERGGLSACEAVAILEDREWRKMDDDEAFRRLAELVKVAP
jgi:hypothetical protein